MNMKKKKEPKTKAVKDLKKDAVKDPQEKQFRIIIEVIIGCFVFLILWMIIINASNKFEYMGIDFKKIKYGEIDMFSANVPIKDFDGKVLTYLAVDFRNDPRELRNISVKISNEINFLANRLVYLAVSKDTEKCENSGIAMVAFGGVFLKNAGLDAKVASIDKEYAETQDIPYITCKNASQNTVIIIKNSSETKITETSENCYGIEFKDCKILDAVERFELEVLKQYAKRY